VGKFPAKDVHGTIDIAILTIRQDEFDAVMARFPSDSMAHGERDYMLSTVDDYRVAVVRAVSQGNQDSQQTTNDIIADLDPSWIVVTGIAGGVPDDDFTLGDVVIATRVHEYLLGAAAPSGEEFSVGGGPIAEEITRFTASLSARQELDGWNAAASIRLARPIVDPTSAKTVGTDDWQRKIRGSLERHFVSQPRSTPIATIQEIASTDRVVKDPALLLQWLPTARRIRAVEMELAGAYRAARKRFKTYPVLSIRGISDIVGLARDEDWTKYACETAAAFTRAMLRARPVTPRSTPPRRDTRPTPSVPKIDRPLSSLERDRLLKAAFRVVADHFEAGIAAARKDDGMDAEFDMIDAHTFEASISVRGGRVERCKIWLGSPFGGGGSKQICYSQNLHGSGMNDWIDVTDVSRANNITFAAFMPDGSVQFEGIDPKSMTEDQVAAYLWGRFTDNFRFQ
jgi:nucleoside phosphorylase